MKCSPLVRPVDHKTRSLDQCVWIQYWYALDRMTVHSFQGFPSMITIIQVTFLSKMLLECIPFITTKILPSKWNVTVKHFLQSRLQRTDPDVWNMKRKKNRNIINAETQQWHGNLKNRNWHMVKETPSVSHILITCLGRLLMFMNCLLLNAQFADAYDCHSHQICQSVFVMEYIERPSIHIKSTYHCAT